MLIQFLRMLALSMGFAGWLVIAIVFYWVESNGGQVILHNNRAWPPYEAAGDMAAIAIAFFIITIALVYEIVSHYKRG